MDYQSITDDEQGRRTAQRLLALREQLAKQGPPPKTLNNLLLATWNIREFDSPAYGERLPEAFFYIAEIISHFDVVAVQEVRENLDALERVQRLLGDWWRYIATDVTEGTAGNRERMVFLYDTRKVRFGGVAGEIVIPPVEKTLTDGEHVVYEPSKQLFRTPFICGFDAGWSRFMLCTVHIQYGVDEADSPERIAEIKIIAEFLAKRAREKPAWSNNFVLLGDFNIYSTSDLTMRALIDAGFEIPIELQNVPPTNTGKEKHHYDQIAFQPIRMHFDTTGRAGVFDYYQTVFRDLEADMQIYAESMGDAFNTTSKGKPRDDRGKLTYYRTYWRTHQMSDHFPMWVELRTDFSAEFLREKSG